VQSSAVGTRHTLDAALIQRARDGDMSAFSILHERNAAAAMAMARGMSRSTADAEDLVAEAFTKVMEAVRRGNGPDDAFRPYLLTTIRRLAYDSTARRQREQVSPDVGEDAVVELDDPAVLSLERGLVRSAFASLPDRWQTVLWQTEVEGQRPHDIAPALGLSANAAAALTYRAREGLREAYLDAHRRADAAPGCGRTLDRLPAYVRGSLGSRGERAVAAHIETCERCLAAYIELIEINSELRAAFPFGLVLGAAVLGATATSAAVRAGGARRAVRRISHAGPRGLAGSVVSGAITVVAVAAAAVALSRGSAPQAADPPAGPVTRGLAVSSSADARPRPSTARPTPSAPLVVPPPAPTWPRQPPAARPATPVPVSPPISRPRPPVAPTTVPRPPTTEPSSTTTLPTPTTAVPPTTAAPGPTTTTTTAPTTTVPPTTTTVPPTTTTTVPPTTTTTTTVPDHGDEVAVVATPIGTLHPGQPQVVVLTVSGLPPHSDDGFVTVSVPAGSSLDLEHRWPGCAADGEALRCALPSVGDGRMTFLVGVRPASVGALEIDLTFSDGSVPAADQHIAVTLAVTAG
jgi:RNA polymerase sigma factor (sigma-70 family)